MIGRRGFLKALGIGVAAGPATAKTLTDLTPSGLGLSSSAYSGFSGLAGDSGPGLNSGTTIAEASTYNHGKWLIARLRELADPSILHDRHRDTHVSVLDADLASMASLSLSSKIRIQRRVNFDRDVAARREALWFELKQFRNRK